jgi:hypothetical protein
MLYAPLCASLRYSSLLCAVLIFSVLPFALRPMLGSVRPMSRSLPLPYHTQSNSTHYLPLIYPQNYIQTRYLLLVKEALAAGGFFLLRGTVSSFVEQSFISACVLVKIVEHVEMENGQVAVNCIAGPRMHVCADEQQEVEGGDPLSRATAFSTVRDGSPHYPISETVTPQPTQEEQNLIKQQSEEVESMLMLSEVFYNTEQEISIGDRINIGDKMNDDEDDDQGEDEENEKLETQIRALEASGMTSDEIAAHLKANFELELKQRKELFKDHPEMKQVLHQPLLFLFLAHLRLDYMYMSRLAAFIFFPLLFIRLFFAYFSQRVSLRSRRR